MSRSFVKAAAFGLLLAALFGCSGSHNGPTLPGSENPDGLFSVGQTAGTSTRILWAVWDVCIDADKFTMETIPDRGASFTFNATHFVQGPPVEMTGKLVNIDIQEEFIYVTTDIGLKNPFDEDKFPGFDVIAVFMGEGSEIFPGPDGFSIASGEDQNLLNPDGWTRWYNYPEFSGAGSIWKMFGYNAFETGIHPITPSAILNPFKYYADGLGITDDPFDFISANYNERGSFAPQAKNERRFELRFPKGKPVAFELAIVASWKANYNNPGQPDSLLDFPPEANSDESLLINIEDESTVYYLGPSDFGGKVRLKISPWDWSAELLSTTIDEYEIRCWSDAWVGDGDVDMVPDYSALKYFTFKTAIPVTDVQSKDPIPVWIEIVYPGMDYANDFGVPNDASGNLASYFYYEVPVLDFKPVWIEVLSPNGGEQLEVGKDFEITWETENLPGKIFIMYSTDDFVTDIHPVAVNETNDGSFLWHNIPDIVSDRVKLKVSWMQNSSVNDVSDDYFAIYDSTEPFIRVVKPNGGEFWKAGTQREIRWVSKNVQGTIFIEYSKDNFVSDVHIIAVDTANDGSFMWSDIPNDLSETVRVRISSMINPDIFDISDGDFIIDDPPIEVLSPDGGEEWKAGTSHDIEWETLDFEGTLRIEYSTDYFVSDVHPIAENVVDDGIYTWNPVPFDPSSTARIRISSMDNASIRDISDGNFSIEESGWGLSFGGVSNEIAYGISLDDSANIYLTGIYSGANVDFDPDQVGTDLHTSVGGMDIFLSKISPLADFEWARTWGSSAYDRGYSVATDPDGNVVVTGVFKGTNIDFDPGPGINEKDLHTAVGSYDVFVSRFDSSGEFLWARTFGSTFEDKGAGIDTDQFGNVYLTGNFRGTCDFNPGTGTESRTAVGDEDVFLLSLDSGGNFIWVDTWGGETVVAGYDNGYAVEVGDFGDVWVAGNVAGENIDLDPDAVDEYIVSALGGCDAFISKFDLSGNFELGGIWGGYQDDYGFGLTTDSDGYVYVAGRFEGMVDFDPGTDAEVYISGGVGYDAYLSRFDFLGSHEWARVWGGVDLNDYGWDVSAGGLDTIYVIGNFEGACDFDPSVGVDERTSHGGYDIFLSSFNTSGWFNWARTWGGDTAMDNGYGVNCDANGNAFITGSIAGIDVDFDPGETEDLRDTLNADAFIMKVMPDGEW